MHIHRKQWISSKILVFCFPATLCPSFQWHIQWCCALFAASPSYRLQSGMVRWDLCSYGWCHLSWQGIPAPCATASFKLFKQLGGLGFKSLISLACALCAWLKFHSLCYHGWKHRTCTERPTLKIHSLLTSKQLHFSWITQRHFPAITTVRPNFGLLAAVVAIKEH